MDERLLTDAQLTAYQSDLAEGRHSMKFDSVNHYDDVDALIDAYVAQQEMLAAKDAEIAVLKRWQEWALAVEREWDAQAVGREVGTPLGVSIRASILPAVLSYKAEIERLMALLEESIPFIGWGAKPNDLIPRIEAAIGGYPRKEKNNERDA